MATEWYYRSMDSVIGPLSSKDLLRKVRAGEVLPTTAVRKDDSQWVAAAEVGGLFEEAVKASFSRLCPYCSTEVTRTVPCVCPGCDRLLHRLVRRRDANRTVMPDGQEKLPDQPEAQQAEHDEDVVASGGFLGILKRAFQR